ncbi:MAG: nucleotidyl transferase AbiEii/AbiGii toxin family protein [Solirubrobacteraceae bacterium]|nr:nucleotidyl transferase AbiEii/AbiGii toxin family protein [Solirubrobacteraceae bacterium]
MGARRPTGRDRDTGGVALDASALTEFQREVARLFFSLPESDGYLLAGGAALVASELTDRPTQDLDLFAHAPIDSVRTGRDALLGAIAARGWAATTIRDTTTFCRLVIHGPDDLLVDLAVDSTPTSPPTVTVLGPTLAPVELAARKLLALFGRAEARDFADVFVLMQRFSKQRLLTEAEQVDPGFDRRVLAQMLATLSRFRDDELPIEPELVATMRGFFAAWAAELAAV